MVEIGILLPNSQRQHRTLRIQKDVLPYALCWLLCPVPAALASIFRMDSISTTYRFMARIRFSSHRSTEFMGQSWE